MNSEPYRRGPTGSSMNRSASRRISSVRLPPSGNGSDGGPMLSATMEAAMIALPEAGGSADDIRLYVERLIRWTETGGEICSLQISRGAAERLFDAGLYPLRHRLGERLSGAGVIEYDANTIAALVDRLFQQSDTFESFWALSDGLLTEETVIPDIRRECPHDALSADLLRLMLLIAIVRSHGGPRAANHCLI